MDQPDINNKSQKKNKDIFLFLIILAIAGILALVFFFNNKKSPADMVIVKVDGKVLYAEPLTTDKDMDIQGYAGGHNMVRIQGGKVRIIDADCPDKVCVHTGAIDKAGQTIVCLPHRLVVEISGTSSKLDSVVK
ncbi:MAG: NusG domain II-containing protein [Clostridiales bacterium]|nr:NusG domain II-containing protein [Clostridiales bacterium]MDU1042266.1 NusG domain II-containing protein [Clostridiales bacterium]